MVCGASSGAPAPVPVLSFGLRSLLPPTSLPPQEVASKFGVLSDDGVALRGLFIIDKEGVIQVGALMLANVLGLLMHSARDAQGGVAAAHPCKQGQLTSTTPASPLQHSTINNLGFGRSVDETKRVLQAIQYIQNNPDEV